jgi:hypothetical protein
MALDDTVRHISSRTIQEEGADMQAKNHYRFPVDKEDILGVSTDKSPAHTGPLEHAVDFCFAKWGDLSVEGKEIYAAADGTVVWIKDDSNKGGPDEKFEYDGNRIVIKHGQGEFTAYEHLKHNGVIPKVGDKVKTGELIGYSGNTGWTYGSHLHFEVFHLPDPKDKEKIQTLKVDFEELE